MENDRPHNIDHFSNRKRKIDEKRTERTNKNDEQITISDNQIEHLSRPRDSNK